MANYVNPANSVEKMGQLLTGISSFALLQAYSRSQIAVGVYDRGLHKVAVILSDESEYDHFESQYGQGQFISRGFYAIPKGSIDEHGNIA